MADHGTVLALPDDTLVEVTAYGLAGAGPTGPTVPTTGQIWPRGQGA